MIGPTARLHTAKSRLAAALWQSDASVVIPGTQAGRRASHCQWAARVGQVLMMVPSPAIHYHDSRHIKLHLLYLRALARYPRNAVTVIGKVHNYHNQARCHGG